MEGHARLLITCTDRPGIVAAVSGFLTQYRGNITALDQHTTDPEQGCFFMRVAFRSPDVEPPGNWLRAEFRREVAEPFEMDWHLSFAAEHKRMAILVSRPDHALLELLWRWSRGELPAELAGVISNHPDHREAVEAFGLPYRHIPVEQGAQEEAEAAMLDQLGEWGAELVVLARYMRILSPGFVAQYPSRIINIHHSFLPAFAGSDPYRQAFERGVKLIGATAHYATSELDAGPVIEQDVIRVSHRDGVADLRERGREVERSVLARAVRWHLEDRVAVWGNRTVVFGT
ncbi:formyltetrahydrofolate deformylase [Thiohalorhabdus denitrificans]|uniref:Formyltetrahydrofolate deformylase n=2 Tax=Thiohalorhabdus denitrificans TaxID=381306 RepID=A0A0N8PNH2_9GAMM|nr:formyltetrahydrofolate deformylase [Thiohalorhabdus denitrificans]KPV41517.1 formyltetrahydrofolate deformylase [Thiohalorhabdus denitrificans]SCY30319.1 formyltetrahydrofolate deformylase [Thiohalorhabdus denitrificans]